MYFTYRPISGKPQSFPRIIGAYTDASASAYYRIQVPMTALAEAGYPVAWGPIEHFMSLPRTAYDMVITSRTGTGDPSRVEAALQSEREVGHIVVMDYDDHVLAIPEHNPAQHKEHEGFKMAMRTADAVVVTNGTLRRELLPYANQIGVVPNYIDKKQWAVPEFQLKPDTAPVRIGLFGSITHYEDWKIAEYPLRRIMREFDNVEIYCGGFRPAYLADIAIELPWEPLKNYPAMLSLIDIGLCPLADDLFNRCKSPIKAYEYGMAGATVIASPIQYQSVVQGRGTIARNEEEWYQALRMYVMYPFLRKQDAEQMYRHVSRRIDVRAHTDEIADVYRTLYKEAHKRRQRVSKVA